MLSNSRRVFLCSAGSLDEAVNRDTCSKNIRNNGKRGTHIARALLWGPLAYTPVCALAGLASFLIAGPLVPQASIDVFVFQAVIWSIC